MNLFNLLDFEEEREMDFLFNDEGFNKRMEEKLSFHRRNPIALAKNPRLDGLTGEVLFRVLQYMQIRCKTRSPEYTVRAIKRYCSTLPSFSISCIDVERITGMWPVKCDCFLVDVEQVSSSDFTHFIRDNGLQLPLKNGRMFVEDRHVIGWRSGPLVIVPIRQGVPLTKREVKVYFSKDILPQITEEDIRVKAIDGVAVRFKVRPQIRRYCDDCGLFYFLSYEVVCIKPSFSFGSTSVGDPVFYVERRYMEDSLDSYLSAIADMALPDLGVLASPSFYGDVNSCSSMLQAVGYRNFQDAYRIVEGLLKVYSPTDKFSVLSRGEGFGFLMYHFSREFPNAHFYGYDTSEAMCSIAKELGTVVHSEPPADGVEFDLEILMHVISLGVLPTQKRVIVLDEDRHFEGSSSFRRCGALSFKGMVPFLTDIKVEHKRNFSYSAACHRAVVNVEQSASLHLAVNTIGATLVSETLELIDRSYKVSDSAATVVFLSMSEPYPKEISADLPVYLVDQHNFLTIPGVLEDVLDFTMDAPVVVGVPIGNFSFLSRSVYDSSAVVSSALIDGMKTFLFSFNVSSRSFFFSLPVVVRGFVRNVSFVYSPFFSSQSPPFFPYIARVKIKSHISQGLWSHNHGVGCGCSAFALFKGGVRVYLLDPGFSEDIQNIVTVFHPTYVIVK